MKAKDVKYIVIHCTAGYGDVDSIQRYWREKLKWKNAGYHVVIDRDGTINYLHPFNKSSNGVRYYNHQCLHISYIGGVSKYNSKIAEDTRTDEQKKSIIEVIQEMIEYLKQNGKTDLNTELMVLGHRDFSPDKNLDGVISRFERMKECPSFDAIEEYSLYSSTNKKQLLPYNRK